jgi:hypothetical protein
MTNNWPYIFLFSFFLQISTLNVSLACNCPAPSTPKEEIAETSTLFAGKVINITIRSDNTYVTFHVTKVWKGTVNQTQVVVTPTGESMCGYYFRKDINYLVYALADEDESLRVSQCSGTKYLTIATNDLALLGQGMASNPDPFPVENLLVVLVGAGLFIIAKRLVKRKKYSS